MKIYLAGKMDELGNWRDALLTKPQTSGSHAWILDWPDDPPWDTGHDAGSLVRWPIGANRLVLDTHDYTGPYRSRLCTDWSNKGTAHGNEGGGQHGQIEEESDLERIAMLCEQGVRRCDMVFAYINSFDAFGTFVEIGMARALGKWVVVVENADAIGGYGNELWFVGAEAARHAVYRPLSYKRPVTAGDEHFFLRTVLLEEISRCSVYMAQKERNNKAALLMKDRARGSFEQILRWTSDPRVRDEARRMIRYLDPSGVIAS